MACIEKLKVINSTTGLNPLKAAPTPIPANPISVIGVSMTLLSPYFFHNPRVTYTIKIFQLSTMQMYFYIDVDESKLSLESLPCMLHRIERLLLP